MDRQYYLNLITDTYFKTKNPVASEPAEPMFDLQIKLFREILVRKQKVADREDFVTKDEFFLQCALALDQIKEYIGMQIYFEIDRLHSERESTRTFWFDESGSIQDIPKSVVEDDMLRFQNKIDDFDENNFLVDLSGLGGIITGEICNYDIMLIEEVYEKFNIEGDQPQKLEPEPFDLSDTSAVEKIIYLNELGIIDFLRTKTEFIGSTNLMATVLSAITDVKASTLQTSLNRLINNDTADKNHPYRTQKTVDKVRQTFIDKNIKLKAS
jgi:hypothetical protein